MTSATVSSVASITALTSSQAATISITTANVNTLLPLSGLNGEYKLYVWDASGNLSTGTFNSVFVDGTALTPTLTTTGTVNNNTTISVSSLEIGELYLVHSSVCQPDCGRYIKC